MQHLPIVCAGEYDDDRPLGVFATGADAERFAALYNLERGYGLEDGDRARVEYLRAYPAGDPGASGHEITVREAHWSCTCGRADWSGSEQGAREQAARHIAHWIPAAKQVALPA
ncbi:hypothetical protein C5N14_13575 [Micromonospora sp. MW-13]|uniref:hypothetical protein n=1 Tax=Micromonospora sp. MW-13 TaxID=2094022 RepID=UPI000E43A526|nr:hypothetical protein [Micromonospora sp. MW-13]RGC68411.1 hypothetical protein C5N14_13575 [Micromonospora sp. MW-13]